MNQPTDIVKKSEQNFVQDSGITNVLKLLIARFLGRLYSIDTKLDTLINRYFKAAVKSLECAQNSCGKNKTWHLINAVRFFTESMVMTDINLSNSDKIFAIYYGLALSQYQLQHFLIAINTLEEYSSLDLLSSKKTIIKTQISRLTPKESFVLESQEKASDFAQEIKKVMNQNIYQKIFSKSESELFKKQWEYFKNTNKF